MFRSDDFGKLILRLALGILLLFHGVHKLSHGVAPIAGLLAEHHFPTALAYLAYIGEVVAPVLIILGIYTRLGGLIIAIHMLVAIGLAHMGMLLLISNSGGWAIELQAMYVLSGVAVALLGAGSMALGGRTGRWN